MNPATLFFFLDPQATGPVIAGLAWILLAVAFAAVIEYASNRFGGTL